MASDPLLDIWEKALARSRANPVTLGKHTSVVVGVRFTTDEAAAIREIAQVSRLNGTPSELIRAVTLAYASKDPEAARGLLAVYHVTKNDEAKARLTAKAKPSDSDPLGGAGKSKRKRAPLSPAELAYCERERITEAEFLKQAEARVRVSRTQKKAFAKPGSARLGRSAPRKRQPLTAAERAYCARERLTETEFFRRADARRSK